MAVNPIETYRQQEVLSANRGELLLMLYDGCIKQIKLARLFIAENSMEGAHAALIKAQEIINALSADLDMNYEISESLYDLYQFFGQELMEANISKDSTRLEPVLEMLADLRATWANAVQIVKDSVAAAR